MTTAPGGRLASRSVTRRIGGRRHLLATSLASIVLAVPPITSVYVPSAPSPRTDDSSVGITIEMTARVCFSHSSCGSLIARITPR